MVEGRTIPPQNLKIMTEENIKFVAKRYKRGRFIVKDGWKRLGITPTFNWQWHKIAAAIVGLAFLSATAAFIYNQYLLPEPSAVESPSAEREMPVDAEATINAIDFENTPLPIVVERIKEVYGVEIVSLPDNAEELALSLHYVGNATDLVGIINDILGTNMRVKEK